MSCFLAITIRLDISSVSSLSSRRYFGITPNRKSGTAISYLRIVLGEDGVWSILTTGFNKTGIVGYHLSWSLSTCILSSMVVDVEKCPILTDSGTR